MIETGNNSSFNPIGISPLTVPHIYMSKIVKAFLEGFRLYLPGTTSFPENFPGPSSMN